MLLVVRQHCISQVDYYEGRTLADYCYKDIQAVSMVMCGGFCERHLYHLVCRSLIMLQA